MTQENKKKKKNNPLVIILMIICIAVAIFAAFNLIKILLGYKAGQDEYNKLQRYTVENKVKKDYSTDSKSKSEEKDPNKPPISVDIDSLQKINSEVVGWLYVGCENISYPIVHTNNNEYYLHRTFEKKENFAGSLFVEAQNKGDFTDPNTIIYGHNMKDTSMFGKLKRIHEQKEYLDDNTIWVITKDYSYKYKIFSMQVTEETSDVYTLFSGPGSIVKDYIMKMATDSEDQLPLGHYDENSRVITLSTCMTANTTQRFVVQGILTGAYPNEEDNETAQGGTNG